MNPVFEEIRKTTKSEKLSIEGYVWLNMLIKYNLDGSATVIRSFTKPAKESVIKSIIKPKKKIENPINIDTDNNDASNLF